MRKKVNTFIESKYVYLHEQKKLNLHLTLHLELHDKLKTTAPKYIIRITKEILALFQRNTVRFWIRRYTKEGNKGLIDRERIRRNRKVTTDQLALIRQLHEQQGFSCSKLLAQKFKVNRRTINRCYATIGIYNREDTKRKHLTPDAKAVRLKFAQQYLDFDWTDVVFSDERTFYFDEKNRLQMCRYTNSRYVEYQEMARSSVRVHFWGWLSSSGAGELVELPPRATSTIYLDILDETMLPTVRTVYPQEDFPIIHYVHSIYRTHSARFVSKWFEEHPEVIAITAPGNSPDLNPLDSFWVQIIKMWDSGYERIQESLARHCRNVWESMRGTDTCKEMVGVMRERLEDVIECNGDFKLHPL
jgi:hypothetical protein